MSIPQPILERLIDALENLNQSIAELNDLSQADQHLSNEEVCLMLKIQSDTLRRRIAKQVFVEGYHFTGDRGDRLWSRRRMDRYLETRHDPTLQQNDLKQWHRSLKKPEKS
jgi:hypothetical protein